MRAVSSTLVGTVLFLVALGIVMLASTSSVKGTEDFNDPQYFLKRQMIWLILAGVVGTGVYFFDYHWWQRWAGWLFAGALVLLVAVLVPGIGSRIGGSSRWIRVGPVSLQPSEAAKFAVVVGLSAWMARIGRRAVRLIDGLMAPGLLLGLMLGLLILEPDFGTTLLTGVVGMLILFAGGTPTSHLVVSGVVGVSGFVLAVMQDTVRMNRILAFLMPEKYPAAAYHLAQSRIAFNLGGWTGKGLGNSMQKYLYLPEAHTDFIFAIVGEELGFVFTVLVVLAFLVLLGCGMVISFRAPDPFGRLLSFGLTMMLVLQAAINIGVVTGCLPTKGLPLPFISYGGSSLVMAVAGVAVLLNIAKHIERQHSDDHTQPIKDRAHRF